MVKRENYPEHVQEWMAKIEENVVTDSDLLMQYCGKLERYASEVRSDHLNGFSMFFRGYGYYMLGKLDESMAALSSALNFLVTGDDWFMIARTYNSMGNIADFQGDLSLAIDCYCKGLVISREHGLDILTYSIISNLSNIHIALGETEHAMKMLLECEQLDEAGFDAPLHSRLVIHANLTACHIRMGQPDKAKAYFAKLQEDCRNSPIDASRVTLYILSAELYHALGNTGERDAAITALSAMELQASTVFDALSELYRHALLLLELDKLEEFNVLLKQIEDRAESPNVEKLVLQLYMKYYEKIGDREKCARTAIQFYKIDELHEGMRNKVISHNIKTRIHLDEESAIRKETERLNTQLKQKSEHDPLTGMHNRYKLNELFEHAFHRAYMSGVPLTVEILDIDCYKQFNDNYGHQKGDECLVQVADAIRSMEEYPNVFTARYGGDEFVIIYENYSRDDVEKMVRILQNKIHALNIEHKFSSAGDRVTISQGLFHRIPVGGNKTWDFLHCADLALYGVKRRGKNSYYIGTSLKQVREYSKNEKKMP